MNIEFFYNSLKYKGVAVKTSDSGNVYFHVSFYMEGSPGEMYHGDFYPKRRIVSADILIKWECTNVDIDPRLVALIGYAIEERAANDKSFAF